MPKTKNQGKNKSRFEVRGGVLNEFEFARNEGAMAEEERSRLAELEAAEQPTPTEGESVPASPQEAEAQRIREVIETAHEKAQRNLEKRQRGTVSGVQKEAILLAAKKRARKKSAARKGRGTAAKKSVARKGAAKKAGKKSSAKSSKGRTAAGKGRTGAKKSRAGGTKARTGAAKSRRAGARSVTRKAAGRTSGAVRKASTRKTAGASAKKGASSKARKRG